jgi:hypothetical protein
MLQFVRSEWGQYNCWQAVTFVTITVALKYNGTNRWNTYKNDQQAVFYFRASWNLHTLECSLGIITCRERKWKLCALQNGLKFHNLLSPPPRPPFDRVVQIIHLEQNMSLGYIMLQLFFGFNIWYMWGPGQRSRYSDSIGAAKPADRIPVGVRFSAPYRPALGPTQPSIKWVPGLLPAGKGAGAWSWPPILIYCPGERKSRAIPLLPSGSWQPVLGWASPLPFTWYVWGYFPW